MGGWGRCVFLFAPYIYNHERVGSNSNHTYSNRMHLGVVRVNEKIKFLYSFYKKDLTNYKNFITL